MDPADTRRAPVTEAGRHLRPQTLHGAVGSGTHNTPREDWITPISVDAFGLGFLLLPDLDGRRHPVTDVSHARVLFRHVVPNAVGPVLVLVLATLEVGMAILNVSALSFLGFGAPPSVRTSTTISWVLNRQWFAC